MGVVLPARDVVSGRSARKRGGRADSCGAQNPHHMAGFRWEQGLSKKNSYSYDDLLDCGHGRLFGPGNAQLPLPPMLMFDRIVSITEDGGARGRGQVVGELDVKPDLWFFDCHFESDPVMPGCLGLDALWQLTGFFLGWTGAPGRGRALGVGAVKFEGQVGPEVGRLTYQVDIKRVIRRQVALCIADGIVTADGDTVYTVSDLRVGVFTSTEEM